MTTIHSPETLSAENALVVTRIFDAPREFVWKLWTEPQLLTGWWGPNGYTTPFFKLDLWPGGVMYYCLRSLEGKDCWAKGVYREIVPFERLVISDVFSDEAGRTIHPSRCGVSVDWPAETLITVSFEDCERKTKLTLRYNIHDSVQRNNAANEGWTLCFQRLEDYLHLIKY